MFLYWSNFIDIVSVLWICWKFLKFCFNVILIINEICLIVDIFLLWGFKRCGMLGIGLFRLLNFVWLEFYCLENLNFSIYCNCYIVFFKVK